MWGTVWCWEHISEVFDVKTAPFVVDERCEWEKKLTASTPPSSVYVVNKEASRLPASTDFSNEGKV